MFGRKRRADEDFEYTVVPVIESDYLVHTDAHPFCDDMTCYCHENEENIEETNGYYQDGLLSEHDVKRRYGGRYV